MNLKKYRILLVDDDQLNLISTMSFLSKHNFEIETFSSPLKALEKYKQNIFNYSLLLVDYHMQELNGVEFVKQILKENKNQIIAMFSGDHTKEALKNSIIAGAIDFIERGMEVEEFLKIIKSLCVKNEIITKSITGNETTQEEKRIKKFGMIGRSENLIKVTKEIENISKLKSPVLITGETGTGKELVAKAIHSFSERKDKKFVIINCAAIPENLLESQLFGHNKGSFTGAINKQIGKFTFAHRGTLFLDEIGDMPLNLQAKLLRVLQEGVIDPVGSLESENVDVRVITATHKNLEDMVKKGLFREDLYYRINGLNIHLEPLRNRIEDIEPLVAHFTEEYCKENNQNKRFHFQTLEIFKSYSWPGNIRELKNIIIGHLARSNENIVSINQLSSNLFIENTSKPMITFEDYEKKQFEVLKNLISTTMKLSESKNQAAKRLKISASRLHYMLERLNI